MKTSILVVALATTPGALSSIFKRTGCNANNCLRQIRGTDVNLQPPLTSRESDCSTFMITTVTPATYTATTTVTITTVVPPAKRDVDSAPLVAPRQVTVSPTTYPAYATDCPSYSAYSSACSCIGITPTVTTVPTPTTTTTVTAYQTISPYQCSPANYQPCGGSCGGICLPTNADGFGICQVDSDCAGRPSCSTDADCPGGYCLNDACGQMIRKRTGIESLNAPIKKRQTGNTDSGAQL
ncbi:hypothetical protein L207DRAFT_599483 [Hyaloscypha variabilis F]|uniref:Uncharacterized protein n=1 Tax=Hyaloscypha variabilis (strain UAMH 11265 / GT02V1 / F) TaxID=1149755 RepID=A0A2J6RF65_HYAVF|nr:hypothetical protein L207DRAFT_599483 [Hyaloscypha variabilis F]